MNGSRSVLRMTVAVAAAMGLLVASGPASSSGSGSSVTADVGSAPTIAAVGDIACNSLPREHTRRCRYNRVAALVERLDVDRFLPLGDIQYLHGDLDDFRAYYHRYFHDLKPISSPVAGNHETYTLYMRGFLDYFGDLVPSSRAYYSYDLGGWHLIALNSQLCKGVTWNRYEGKGHMPVVHGENAGGCRRGDAQYEWLARDLAAHPNSRYPCTLAYWHHAWFRWGVYPKVGHWVKPLIRQLYRARADVILNGHYHNYQRFAPQDPYGNPDPRGLTEFIVGTGGSTYSGAPDGVPRPANLVAFQGRSFGALEMRLRDSGYDYRFVSAPGERDYADSGSADCV